MTPTELIRVIGPIVFGPRWQTDMAVTLGINARSVRRWAAGTDIPRAGLWRELVGLMQERADELVRLIPEAEELASGKGKGEGDE
jgi:hypothetical protein